MAAIQSATTEPRSCHSASNVTEQVSQSLTILHLEDARPGTRLEVEDLSATAVASQSLDTMTLLKLLSAGFSFFVAGVNDGSTGALIPYVIREYGISTAVVSGL